MKPEECCKIVNEAINYVRENELKKESYTRDEVSKMFTMLDHYLELRIRKKENICECVRPGLRW